MQSALLSTAAAYTAAATAAASTAAASTTTGTSSVAFNKVFPSAATEQGSAIFVKKLVAVAISNITFIRCFFPRDAFQERSVDGLAIKVLKHKKNPCEEAAGLAADLLGVFEAIERKFLRELVLMVHADP